MPILLVTTAIGFLFITYALCYTVTGSYPKDLICQNKHGIEMEVMDDDPQNYNTYFFGESYVGSIKDTLPHIRYPQFGYFCFYLSVGFRVWDSNDVTDAFECHISHISNFSKPVCSPAVKKKGVACDAHHKKAYIQKEELVPLNNNCVTLTLPNWFLIPSLLMIVSFWAAALIFLGIWSSKIWKEKKMLNRGYNVVYNTYTDHLAVRNVN